MGAPWVMRQTMRAGSVVVRDARSRRRALSQAETLKERRQFEEVARQSGHRQLIRLLTPSAPFLCWGHEARSAELLPCGLRPASSPWQGCKEVESAHPDGLEPWHGAHATTTSR